MFSVTAVRQEDASRGIMRIMVDGTAVATAWAISTKNTSTGILVFTTVSAGI